MIMTCNDDEKEKSNYVKRVGALTIANTTDARSYVYRRSKNGNEFPRGGYESKRNFSSLSFNVLLRISLESMYMQHTQMW